jgi:hypothetical protein
MSASGTLRSCIGWIVNERALSCEKMPLPQRLCVNPIGNSHKCVANTLDLSRFHMTRSRKRGPAGCQAKGRRLLGGMLRSAAELQDHHADFKAM